VLPDVVVNPLIPNVEFEQTMIDFDWGGGRGETDA
jgi:hypothetical protein